ncbi:MAG: hypothetical protein ABFD04_01940 [Syntrophomonas sp.]
MKRIVFIGLLIILLSIMGGCASEPTGQPKGADTPMEGWQKNVVDTRQQKADDDPVQELNHWKYGVKPGEDISYSQGKTGTGGTEQDNPAAAYPGLTEKEYKYVISEMLNWGYLKTKSPTSKQLEDGVRLLQSDNHIPQTGRLDAATLKLLGL